MACEWHVLIEENKDNSLQFAKVFSHQILKVTNLPSFPRHHFVLYGTGYCDKLTNKYLQLNTKSSKVQAT